MTANYQEINGRWMGDEVSYGAAHERLRNSRGVPVIHECRCGDQAEEWAYDGLDPAEKTDKRGIKYSVDPDHYEPLCLSCHRKQDARPHKPCTGDWQDYRRHLRRGETACPESKRAWRLYVAKWRKQ